jgi:hypothetical protein
MLDPETIADLDPNIRQVVLFLDAAGFTTTDSGDAGHKPEDERTMGEIAHVCCVVAGSPVAEADRMFQLLSDIGVDVKQQGPDVSDVCIQADYDPATKSGSIMLMGLTDDKLPALR